MQGEFFYWRTDTRKNRLEPAISSSQDSQHLQNLNQSITYCFFSKIKNWKHCNFCWMGHQNAKKLRWRGTKIILAIILWFCLLLDSSESKVLYGLWESMSRYRLLSLSQKTLFLSLYSCDALLHWCLLGQWTCPIFPFCNAEMIRSQKQPLASAMR